MTPTTGEKLTYKYDHISVLYGLFILHQIFKLTDSRGYIARSAFERLEADETTWLLLMLIPFDTHSNDIPNQLCPAL